MPYRACLLLQCTGRTLRCHHCHTSNKAENPTWQPSKPEAGHCTHSPAEAGGYPTESQHSSTNCKEKILKGQSKVPDNTPVLTAPALCHALQGQHQSILHLQQGPATVCNLPESLYFMISFTSVLHCELAELKGTASSSLQTQLSWEAGLVWFVVRVFCEEFKSTLYLRHTAAIGDHPLGNEAVQPQRANTHPKSNNNSDLLWGSHSTSVPSSKARFSALLPVSHQIHLSVWYIHLFMLFELQHSLLFVKCSQKQWHRAPQVLQQKTQIQHCALRYSGSSPYFQCCEIILSVRTDAYFESTVP